MSAKRKTVSTSEPADRPYMVALSKAEIITLVNHHVKMIKGITKRAGSAMAVASPKELKTLQSVVQQEVNAHGTRGRGLLSIIKE